MAKVSPEAEAVISKIKGKGKAPVEPDADDKAGDTMGEAKRAGAEDIFRALTGREPKETETDAFVEAMDTYMEACGY